MPTVLIVDDAAFLRKKLRDMLEKNGYDVVAEAADGAQALTEFNAKRPEITTMDITMPNVDGLKAIQGIRKVDPRAKVVVVSAMGHKSRVLDAMNVGAQGFIVKPFDEPTLLQVLQDVLDGKPPIKPSDAAE